PPPASPVFPYTTLFRSRFAAPWPPPWPILRTSRDFPEKGRFCRVSAILSLRRWSPKGPPALSRLRTERGAFVQGRRQGGDRIARSEEHTSELQSRGHIV